MFLLLLISILFKFTLCRQQIVLVDVQLASFIINLISHQRYFFFNKNFQR